MPTTLHFHCRFLSPFHSSAHNFSNVSTCAAFVPGSALRGAVLRWLIDRHCTEIDKLHECNPCYHRKCQADCPLKPLFAKETQLRCTFGRFDDGEGESASLTRVSLARDTRSAAEGGLWTAEVRYGSFTFGVRVPDDRLWPLLCEAVKGAGELGVGRNKSLGWGRFEVLSNDARPPAAAPTPAKVIHWRFTAPYVIRHPETGDPFNKEPLQADLEKAWDRVSAPPSPRHPFTRSPRHQRSRRPQGCLLLLPPLDLRDQRSGQRRQAHQPPGRRGRHGTGAHLQSAAHRQAVGGADLGAGRVGGVRLRCC